MAELLIFAHDFSVDLTVPLESVANLQKLGDLITWQNDGWIWSPAELSSPLFRLFKWVGADSNELNMHLSPMLSQLDMNNKPITYPQYRLNAFDFTVATQVVQDYFNDATRQQPFFEIINDVDSLSNLSYQRAPILIPVVVVPPPVSVPGPIRKP